MAPGVLAVLTPKNAPKVAHPERSQEGIDRTWAILRDDAVAYDGQPIAIVVAESLEQGLAAAALLAPRLDGTKGAYVLEDERGSLYTTKPSINGARAGQGARRLRTVLRGRQAHRPEHKVAVPAVGHRRPRDAVVG